MSAVSRIANLLPAALIAVLASAAPAQQAPPEPAAPASDSIGPRELRDFSIQGNVTRPADPPATASPPAARPRSTEPREVRPAPQRQVPRATPAPTRQERSAATAPAAPTVDSSLAGLGNPAAARGFAPTAPLAPPASLPPALPAERPWAQLWPWLLAGMAAAAGAAMLLLRNRRRAALAGGPVTEPVTEPEPHRPPLPPKPSPPPRPVATAGIVSTRLRPWLELDCRPIRCRLDDKQLTVEFELDLYNSGSAAASGIMVEARLMNAGPHQDEELQAFFAQQPGDGPRSLSIAPLNRLPIRSEISAPRDQLIAYELGGKRVFVPLIGFSAHYGWARNDGQTGVSYMLGRPSAGDKLAPFPAAAGTRLFEPVAVRRLDTSSRR